jgi:hypothetical protein
MTAAGARVPSIHNGLEILLLHPVAVAYGPPPVTRNRGGPAVRPRTSEGGHPWT